MQQLCVMCVKCVNVDVVCGQWMERSEWKDAVVREEGLDGVSRR